MRDNASIAWPATGWTRSTACCTRGQSCAGWLTSTAYLAVGALGVLALLCLSGAMALAARERVGPSRAGVASSNQPRVAVSHRTVPAHRP